MKDSSRVLASLRKLMKDRRYVIFFSPFFWCVKTSVPDPRSIGLEYPDSKLFIFDLDSPLFDAKHVAKALLILHIHTYSKIP